VDSANDMANDRGPIIKSIREVAAYIEDARTDRGEVSGWQGCHGSNRE